jgi:hypothetical protein
MRLQESMLAAVQQFRLRQQKIREAPGFPFDFQRRFRRY